MATHVTVDVHCADTIHPRTVSIDTRGRMRVLARPGHPGGRPLDWAHNLPCESLARRATHLHRTVMFGDCSPYIQPTVESANEAIAWAALGVGPDEFAALHRLGATTPERAEAWVRAHPDPADRQTRLRWALAADLEELRDVAPATSARSSRPPLPATPGTVLPFVRRHR